MMKTFSTFVVPMEKDGSHVDGQAGGGREGELPESRANGRSLARRHRRPGGRRARAGERAIQRTTFASHGPLTGWIEGRKEGRKEGRTRQNLCSCRYSVRSLASNTTIDHRFRVHTPNTAPTFSFLGTFSLASMRTCPHVLIDMRSFL